MDEDRIKHSLAVARKMVEIGILNNMSKEELNACFLIGYNHDIGYEFYDIKIDHAHIGGNILKEIGFNYWKEIYYHGAPNCTYKSKYLTILNQADMQIDKYGNDVGYKKRLDNIKQRYGIKSIQYINCNKLINELINVDV